MNKGLVSGAGVVVLAAAIWWFTSDAPIPVSVTRSDRGQVEASVANTRAGTVEACRRARMAPPTGGQIARLPHREGDRVGADEILVELWNKDVAARVGLAEQQSHAAAARVEEACALATVARSESGRLTDLNRRGIASEEATEQGAAQATSREAACRAARAQVGVADAEVRAARAALERTLLRAPFAGIIAEINGEIGEFVTPSPLGVATLPTVDLLDPSCLYVAAPIDEIDAAAVVAGLPARITVDAFPDTPLAGRVRRVAPYVLDLEKQARTVDVEVEILEPASAPRLMAGQSADVEIVLESRDTALRVPTETVREGGKLFVIEDGVVVERTIESGLANWRFTEVTSGIEDGTLIVLSGDREGVEPGAAVVDDKGKGSDGTDS